MKVKFSSADKISSVRYINPKNLNKLKIKYPDLEILEGNIYELV